MANIAASLIGALDAAPQVTPMDAAAKELALAYAEQIDAGTVDIDRAGPALLAVLEALGMTPRVRKQLVKAGDGGKSPLDELRERRRRKQQS